MNELTAKFLGSRSEIALVFFIVFILLVLFTPIPATLLDFLLITNFSFGMMILMLTLHTDKPLSFSTFPTLLLIATLFRLSLNVAATRLILSDAHAGEVIGAIGDYVVGGNYVIGLVVFLILIVVQYIVVTNGAQRVAEVAARFTLDSMPGKQMSIDADLNMGLIDEIEAKERRKNIEREASFYGAMDGASKFVKGDAIAGIIIIIINIVGGLTIGIAQKGMSWGDALHTYTLLTVGDGIITQIPALVISTATGIIVTRAATDAKFGEEIVRQISNYPNILIIVAIALFGLLFLPGIPVLPVITIFSLVGVIAYFAFKSAGSTKSELVVDQGETEDADLYEKITVEPLEIVVGKEAVHALGASQAIIMEKIKTFRTQFANDMGFVIPAVRIRNDNDLAPYAYQIKLHGSKIGDAHIYPDRTMVIANKDKLQALPGIESKEPTYSLPVKWMDENELPADKSGLTLVDAPTVLITHFSEIVKRNSGELLTRPETEALMGRVKKDHSALYDELIPSVLTISDIQKVLRNLLNEKVSVRNIVRIVEILVDYGRATKDHDELSEIIRRNFSSVICEPLITQDGNLNILTLDTMLESYLHQATRSIEGRPPQGIDPAITEHLLKSLGKEVEMMMNKGLKPVLLTSSILRRQLKKITSRVLPHLTVLAMNEIPSSINMTSFGLVKVDPNIMNSAKRFEIPQWRPEGGLQGA